MTSRIFEKRSGIPAPAEALYAYHAAPGAFARLSPPWEPVRVLREEGPFESRRVTLRLGVGPLGMTWVAQHGDAEVGRRFVDRQLRGPFASWTHTHRFEPDGQRSALLDHVEYALPLGPLSAPAAPLVRRRLQRMFAYRHAITAADLARHALLPTPLRVSIAGDSPIATAFAAFLASGGHALVDPAGPEPVDARVVIQAQGATIVRSDNRVRLAFGVVLGHALARKVDAGAPWLALDDAVGALAFVLGHRELAGDFNASNAGAPGPHDLRSAGFSPRLPTIEQARAFELGLAR